MRIFNFLFLFIVVSFCELKGQESVLISTLPIEYKKTITKIINDYKDFELQSIKITDSIQNAKKIFYYNGNFLLNKQENYLFDKDRNLSFIRKYQFDPDSQKFLNLFCEEKYIYLMGYEKIFKKYLKNKEEYAYSKIEKKLDITKDNRLLQNVSKSYKRNSNDTIIIKEIYKYEFDKIKNTETICVEEYGNSRTPKSFEDCNTYLYVNGKISKNKIGNIYSYDTKNRLIREVSFDKNKYPYFEDLYTYDDNKSIMEHERYKLKDSKVLVAKDQTTYNQKGLIQKIIYFRSDKYNNIQNEKMILFFYDKNNKQKMKVDLKSKKFFEKTPSVLSNS